MEDIPAIPLELTYNRMVLPANNTSPIAIAMANYIQWFPTSTLSFLLPSCEHIDPYFRDRLCNAQFFFQQHNCQCHHLTGNLLCMILSLFTIDVTACRIKWSAFELIDIVCSVCGNLYGR